MKTCPYCKINLVIGKAIETFHPVVKVAFSYFDKGVLITCWKCPKCGHSETSDTNTCFIPREKN